MAHWVNRLDQTPSRQVWHNYWETRLTYRPSYLARLSYVHQNAVKHGLVHRANLYPWCSASFFEQSTSPAMVKSIYNFKLEKVSIGDDFDPRADWTP
jgi:putative transposase